MIKFERKETEKAKIARKVLEKAKEKDTGYNKPEVNEALAEMFRGKCYICESKEITSYQIEHLTAHKENLELKYDWNNLFWSCAHCNNIKNARFEPILDCSLVDIDQKIAFRKNGYFGTDEKLEFDALEDTLEIKNTVSLLQEAYYGSTPQKKLEATNIRKKLRRDLSNFKNKIRDYNEAETYEKEDILCSIKKDISPSAPFTAFKRWILRDNKEKYTELFELCGL